MSQYFEQALVAKLGTITALTSILGTQSSSGAPAIFKTAPPQTWQFASNGAALAYSVPNKPKGQVLTGSDGTANARVQLDIYSFTDLDTIEAAAAIFDSINGVPGTWGDGTCTILACIHQGDSNADQPPKTGSDQRLYRIISEYLIQYRLSASGG